MPILKQEIDHYPPDLFERDLAGSKWWALYTLSRREKDLMRRLVKLEVSFYGPVVEVQHRSPNGRLRKVFQPLFSNYVFLCGTEDDRYQAVCTGCVSRDLEVREPERLIKDLRNIHELIESGVELSPEPDVPIGARVRVTSGALEDREGIVIERRGQSRLLVAVDFLQQGASVELEGFEVEPL